MKTHAPSDNQMSRDPDYCGYPYCGGPGRGCGSQCGGEAIMSRKRTYLVTLQQPTTVTDDVMMSYIADAVASWKGQLKPESAKEDAGDWYDPLTDIDEEAVTVRKKHK